MFNTIVASAITALIVSVAMLGLVGNNQPNVGGDTRFPNSDLSAATITSNGAFTSTGAATMSSTLNVTGDITFSADLNTGTATTSTTTLSVGKVCYSFTGVNGTDLYGWYTAAGVWATSTTSCS